MPPSKAWIFRQLFDRSSCTYTYLLACSETKQAVLIDPVLELVERDTKLIKELGLELVYAINTHIHADHVTGSGNLKKNFPQCKSVLGANSGGKADVFVGQGEKIRFGNETLEGRCTPGHTDGCMTYVSHDHEVAFTGDALFIRGCGRTDFQQGSASTLYDVVHEQILSLPEQYKLHPAHDYKGMTVTTVKEEKQFNPRLTLSKEKFIECMANLNLDPPKHIDKCVPANLACGFVDE